VRATRNVIKVGIAVATLWDRRGERGKKREKEREGRTRKSEPTSEGERAGKVERSKGRESETERDERFEDAAGCLHPCVNHALETLSLSLSPPRRRRPRMRPVFTATLTRAVCRHRTLPPTTASSSSHPNRARDSSRRIAKRRLYGTERTEGNDIHEEASESLRYCRTGCRDSFCSNSTAGFREFCDAR